MKNLKPEILCIKCRIDQGLPLNVKDNYEDELCPEHLKTHVPRCKDYTCGTCPKCKAVRDFMRDSLPDAIDLDVRQIMRYDEQIEHDRIFYERRK